MKKRRFPVLLALGALFIFVSFALIVVFQVRTHIGAAKCREVISVMNKLLPEKNMATFEAYQNPNMPTLEIDNTDYVAMLEIPSLSVKLPVADKWNKDKLYNSPARFYGSSYNHSLVIGGGDYPNQFSFCDKIDNGAVIAITDMAGTQFSYTVSRVDRSEKAESKWLSDENFDLTLFCRDIYSMKYIAVRCNFRIQ